MKRVLYGVVRTSSPNEEHNKPTIVVANPEHGRLGERTLSAGDKYDVFSHEKADAQFFLEYMRNRHPLSTFTLAAMVYDYDE